MLKYITSNWGEVNLAYTETDTRAKLIDPQIKSSHWLESHIVREYYFTNGHKLIGGKRGKQYYVDYLLAFQNTNLAIIKAKVENRDHLDGLQQSINYAQKLKIALSNIREGYFRLQREIYR